MHIECPNCGAFFDEDINTHCPRCQTPADLALEPDRYGCCGANKNGCCSSGCCHSQKAESV